MNSNYSRRYLLYVCIVYVIYTLAEILVNKTELKNIRDSIDKILSKQSVAINPQHMLYESEELSERQKEILKYVERKPGATKEDVIKNNPHIGSRMTIVHAIEALIEMRMLIVKRDLNQHIQPLYTNNEHVVLSLFYDLELFKQVYFRLIDETTKKLTNTNRKLPKKCDIRRHFTGSLMWDALEALLLPYKYLMYVTPDLLLWQERPLDKDALHNKFAVVYDSLKEIHTKLYESITPLITSQFYRDLQEPLNSPLYHIQFGLSPEQIIKFLRIFEGFGLVAFVELILDVIWKISYPVLSHPLYASVEKSRKDAPKDWRDVISGYKPKTTQEQNLGKKID
jgi:hypothetical protein